MGRAVPAYGNVNIDRILLSYAFFAAGVAATLSVIITMCGFLTGRKEPTSDNNKDNNNPDDKTESDDVSGENPGPTATDQSEDKTNGGNELPLPPGSKLRGSQSTVIRSKSEKPTVTKNKLRVTSMKDVNIHTKDKNTKEDSIWMKPIILGEKCKVPGNSSEGDDKAMINVDGSMIASTNFRNHSRQFNVSRNIINEVVVEKNNTNVDSNPSS